MIVESNSFYTNKTGSRSTWYFKKAASFTPTYLVPIFIQMRRINKKVLL
jgi:hypothetical protein